MSITGFIEEQRSGQPAVVAGKGRAIDYGAMRRDLAAAVIRLREAGIDQHSRVAIHAGGPRGGQGYSNWIAHLAVMRIGASHSSVIEPKGLTALFHHKAVDIFLGAPLNSVRIPREVRDIPFALPVADDGEVPLGDNHDQSAARINLSSGTTGSAKMLRWDAATLEGRVDQVAETLGLDAGCRLYPLLHLRTTAGFRYPLAVWRAGGCVLLPEHGDAAQRDRIGIRQSTLIVCSPSQLSRRLDMMPGAWPGREERRIAVLGGRLPRAVRDAALARACRQLIISYGSTESGTVASGDGSVIDRHVGAVGHVRPGLTVEVVDPGDAPVAAGETGIIRIQSPLMCDSYEDGSAGRLGLNGGWFYPGDIGRLFDDGLLAIEGRVSETVNIAGSKMSAVDLESRVGRIAGVRDLCACVLPLDEGDLLTFAVVADSSTDLKEVAAQIRMAIRGQPFHLVGVKSIPRNAMGKVPRQVIANKLTALYGGSKRNISRA